MALRAHVRCFPEPGAFKIPSNFNKVYFAPNQETSHLRSQSEMGCVCVCQRSSRWTSPLLSSPSILSRLFVNKYPSLYTCLLWLFFAFLVQIILNRENRNATFYLSSNKNLIKNLNSWTPRTSRRRKLEHKPRDLQPSVGIWVKTSAERRVVSLHPQPFALRPRASAAGAQPLPAPQALWEGSLVPARARPRVGRRSSVRAPSQEINALRRQAFT